MKRKKTAVGKKPLWIAIDGPVAAGKSSVSRLLAKKLGILYADTGAMYRAVAWGCQIQGIDWEHEAAVSGCLQSLRIALIPPIGVDIEKTPIQVELNGIDITKNIRTQEMGEGASIVSQYKAVREFLVALQQRIAKHQSLVMEGRDIGSVVLPEADLKIYLDADINVRVAREIERRLQLGKVADEERVREQIMRRDEREMTRKISPLKQASDAHRIDSSKMSIDQVVDSIIALLPEGKIPQLH